MRYVLEDNGVGEKEFEKKPATADQLIDGMDPVGDKYDRRILFELTKRRMEEIDYQSDTSFEEDMMDDDGGDQTEEVERRLLVNQENNLINASNGTKMSIRPLSR